MRCFGLFTLLASFVLLSACSPNPSGPSQEDRDEPRIDPGNDLSEFEAEWKATEPHHDPRLETDLLEEEAFRRWQESVRPTPRGAFPKIGTCYETAIRQITGRLGDTPSEDGGTQVFFDNGLMQVDYDLVPEIVRGRPGDKVKMCVIELPKDCPPGDFRGIVYRTHDRRTGEEWELADSHHMCGGA